jgi:hypothetical protein
MIDSLLKLGGGKKGITKYKKMLEGLKGDVLKKIATGSFIPDDIEIPALPFKVPEF